MFWMSEKEFRATLTPRQLDIYLNCIIGGQSKIDYAAANNMQRQSVYNAATLIMKKAKYFFQKILMIYLTLAAFFVRGMVKRGKSLFTAP